MNKIYRTRWINSFLILFLFLTTNIALARTEFTSQEKFSEWITFYYKNPDPNRIPDAVKYMSRSGILDNKNATPPIFGFLSGVFRKNPEKINTWLKDWRNLKENHLEAVILGLWYSGLPDSKLRASSLLDKHPKLKPEFSFMIQASPMVIEEIPLEQGPWVLDALWGEFMATGEKTPVQRIISVLTWSDIKGDINRLMVGGSARWSLTSNAIQHKKVLEICEETVATQNADVATKLGEVINTAKKELQAPKNSAIDTGAAR